MRTLGAVFIIIICVALFLGVLKLTLWWINNSKKTDIKWFKVEFEDYESKKVIAIIRISGFFVLLVTFLLYEYFTHW